MGNRKNVAQALASAMLCGSLSEPGLSNRGAAVIGRRPSWLQALAKRVIAHFGRGSRPRHFRLERFIINDAKFFAVYERQLVQTILQPRFVPRMCPASGPPRRWTPRPLLTLGEVAQWLNLTPNELAWFADCRTQEQKLSPGPLRHYRYRWQSKRDGSLRLIEAPKQHLKSIQRSLLQEILAHIPPHEAAHGFRPGRSIRSFVQSHVGRDLVLRLDLKDFFPGILHARIFAIFLTAGYPESVARALAGLCTNSVPGDVVRASCSPNDPKELRRLKLLYQRPHLAQGAPTSPALANLAAYRLDCRLAGLAAAAGAHYTRYADDLLFSGNQDFPRMAYRFYIQVCAIALEEGFEVNTRKSHLMRQSVSQRAAGVILNRHPNTPRADFDRLKAIIHNCVDRGPSGQNRANVPDFRAHLAGKIAHLEWLNPVRGQKLRQQFDLICWT